jgi:hypothetical protein
MSDDYQMALFPLVLVSCTFLINEKLANLTSSGIPGPDF